MSDHLAPIVFEAIVRKLCIAGSYNRAEVTIAPHVIYKRHDELYVDAITMDRDGRPPKEEKIGTFKLAGLAPIRLTARRFPANPLFQPDDPKYVGNALLAVETEAA